MSGGNGGERRPYYTGSISLGNILSIVAVVVTVVLTFSDLKGDVRVLTEKVGNNDKRLNRVETRVGLGEHPMSTPPSLNLEKRVR